MELTECEQQLVVFALKQFGDPLCQFLLTGLGKEERVKRRIFNIKFNGPSGTILHRDIQLGVNAPYEASSFLPWMRDPLVILALLKLLLLEHQTTSASLFYGYQEVLRHLGWENTPESHHKIDEAVERYADLTYRWELSKEELADRNLSFLTSREILISGYSFVDLSGEDGEQPERITNQVDFSMSSIQGLTRKALFEINWNDVISVTPVSISSP